MSDKPLLASGRVVKDYRPLMRFLKELPSNIRNEVLPTSDDLEFVKSLAKSSTNLAGLLNSVKERVRSRVAKHAGMVRRIVREAWGVDLSEELAVEEVSKELAGWVIEISETLGYIRIYSRD